MKSPFCRLLMVTVALCVSAFGQRFELNGGYAHISGNQGVDGFTLGGAMFFSHRVSIAADYDTAWDTSQIGIFETTQTGVVVSKSHLQNILFGPRIFFPGAFKTKDKHIALLMPFAEAEFGVSHLSSNLENPTLAINQSNSDNAFSWMLGGGADYRFSPHWVGRFNLDLLRTHFSDEGQSRLRLVLGVAYTFGNKSP